MNKSHTNWKEFKLGDIGTFLRGSGISKKDLSESGTPAIRYGDIYTKYDYVIKNISSFTNSKGTELKKGDILFAGSGETISEIGKSVAFIDDIKALAGGDIIIFRPSVELDSIFLSYMLNTGTCRKYLSVMGQGATIAHIYSYSLKKLSVFLPPLEEQKRIASALSKIDAYLENTIKLIKEKERFKNGIAKKLLTCKEGENIPEARFECFNDEWETKSLISVASIKKGEQRNKLDLIPNGKYPVLNGGKNFSGYYNSYNREANTITISEGGNAGYVNFIKEKFWSSGHCYTLHDLKIDKHFLYQCLKNSEKRLMKLQLGTALKNIQMSEIKEFTLDMPKSIEEQKAIGEYLSLLDAEIDNLKEQKEEIKKMKKGMINKLMAGEIRI